MADAVGAVVGVGASLIGMSQQKKAMKEQEKAMKEQRRLQVAADQRERRQLLRQTAIARGQTVNVAAQIGGGQGATAGTGLVGGLSGLESQGISAVNFQATSRASIERQQNFLNNAAEYQTRASIASGVAAASSQFGAGLSGLGGKALGASGLSNPMQSYGLGMRFT